MRPGDFVTTRAPKRRTILNSLKVKTPLPNATRLRRFKLQHIPSVCTARFKAPVGTWMRYFPTGDFWELSRILMPRSGLGADLRLVLGFGDSREI